jgi:hypothetical protein
MKKVLDFIIEQGLEIGNYSSLLEPLRKNFNIKDHNNNEATEDFINTVIFWENHTEIYDSLEKFLSDRFILK